MNALAVEFVIKVLKTREGWEIRFPGEKDEEKITVQNELACRTILRHYRNNLNYNGEKIKVLWQTAKVENLGDI